MDEQHILQKFKEIEEKLDEVYESTERTRKYIRNMLIFNIVVFVLFFVLPIIGLIFVIPQFLNLYSDLGSLGL